MEDTRIDYAKVLKAIWAHKKLYYKVLPITFLLAVIWIMPQPRYYNCQVMLAPEGAEEVSGGSLSTLASSFGFNLGGTGGDAIYPMLYPDLFSSPEFVVSLLDIQIPYEDNDGKVTNMDYYTYLTYHQKKNWLTQPFKDAFRTVKRWIKPKKPSEMRAGDVSKLDPFRLSYDDYMLVDMMDEIVQCTVDKKTDVTTISVTDQSPVICAIMADSVKARLQVFITTYRTRKARMDKAYYEQLATNAKDEYEEAVSAYGAFCDTHQGVKMQSFASKRDALENMMALKYDTYTTMLTQLEAAKAKVQERTPAFTTLKSATVPVKPAGPKRMIFVGTMLFLSVMGTTFYILRKILDF